MTRPPLGEAERVDSLKVLPAVLTLARHVVLSAFETGDPETEELKGLLDACVVGAHRLVLRERLRLAGPCEAP